MTPTPPLTFRIAEAADLQAIRAIAGVESGTAPDHARRLHLEQAVLEIRCRLALEGDLPLALGLITHTFFGRPFIELLMVHPAHRRRGLGRAMLRHLVIAAGGNGHDQGREARRIFTSTNQSNIAAQRLLEGEGFEASGVIHNLDAGDPELIYVKG